MGPPIPPASGRLEMNPPMSDVRSPTAQAGASQSRSAPRPGLLLAIALVLVAFAYSSSLGGDFVWDDHTLIEHEPAVLELESPSHYFGRMFWANPEFAQGRSFYRPLTTFTYAIEWQLWDGSPIGFRFVNLIAHLVCCTLVFVLSLRAGAPPLVAAGATLLFGTFPRLTESVAWISGRTDIFAGIGALSAWLLHDTRASRGGRRCAAAAAILLGMLCKEVAIAGVAAIVALEFAARRRERDGWHTLAAHLAPVAIALALYAGLRAWATLTTQLVGPDSVTIPLSDRVIFFGQALGTYFAMLLDPLRPRLQIGTLGVIEWHWVAVGAGLLVALVCLVGVMIRRHASGMQLAALALGLASLALVLHLITLPSYIVAADRFLYLPLAGLAIGASGWIATRSPRVRRGAALATLLVIPMFAGATALRSALWADELALWRTAVSHPAPLNGLAYAVLGELLYTRSQPEAALRAFRTAEDLDAQLHRHYPLFGSSQSTRGNIGLCLGEMGDYDQALPILRQLVAENPRAPLNRLNLGLAYARVLQFDHAERELDLALAEYPGYPRALQLLEQLQEARHLWSELPPVGPDEPPGLIAKRATVFSMVGRVDVAERLWSQVVDSAESSAPDLRRAAIFLVVRGDHAAAEAALRRLRALPAQREEAQRLEEALAARRLEEQTARSS